MTKVTKRRGEHTTARENMFTIHKIHSLASKIDAITAFLFMYIYMDLFGICKFETPSIKKLMFAVI